MQELQFLHSARRLMLIDICMKFREDSLRGFQLTERTRFVTDRRTDRRTPREKNMSPNPSGGGGGGGGGGRDIIIVAHKKHIQIKIFYKKCDYKINRIFLSTEKNHS